MIICSCDAKSDKDIRQAAVAPENRDKNFKQVTEVCHFCRNCKRCAPLATEIFKAARAEAGIDLRGERSK
jgi:bacterioferritin-associated ferredoxin